MLEQLVESWQINHRVTLSLLAEQKLNRRGRRGGRRGPQKWIFSATFAKTSAALCVKTSSHIGRTRRDHMKTALWKKLLPVFLLIIGIAAALSAQTAPRPLKRHDLAHFRNVSARQPAPHGQ